MAFHGGLVPGLQPPGRVYETAVMGRELPEGLVDQGVIEVGRDDAGLEVVGLVWLRALCGRRRDGNAITAVNGHAVPIQGT
jgi:hypothetical protein